MIIRKGRRATAREKLEEIAKAFREVAPAVYAEQLEITRALRGALRNKTGTNVSKTMSLRFALHPLVEAFVKRHLGLTFFASKENRDLFLRVWSELKVS